MSKSFLQQFFLYLRLIVNSVDLKKWDNNTFYFTYYVCDEKVQRIGWLTFRRNHTKIYLYSHFIFGMGASEVPVRTGISHPLPQIHRSIRHPGTSVSWLLNSCFALSIQELKVSLPMCTRVPSMRHLLAVLWLNFSVAVCGVCGSDRRAGTSSVTCGGVFRNLPKASDITIPAQ